MAMQSIEVLNAELDSLQGKLSDCNGSIEKLGKQMEAAEVSIAKYQADLEGFRTEQESFIARRGVLEKNIEEVRAKIQTAVSDEAFPGSLTDLLDEYLSGRSLEELNRIDISLNSYRPPSQWVYGVASESSASETANSLTEMPSEQTEETPESSDNPPWAEESDSDEDRPPWEEPENQPKQDATTVETSAQPMGYVGRVLLEDTAEVGTFIRSHSTDLLDYAFKLRIDNELFNLKVSDIVPVNRATMKPIAAKMERVRCLYFTAFLKYLELLEADMSAQSVFDYLIAYKYVNNGGKLTAVYSGVSLDYFRLEDAKGNIIMEPEGDSSNYTLFQIYEDEAGYKIYTGVTACSTYKDVVTRSLRYYATGRSRGRAFEKCRDLVFSSIFKTTYFELYRRGSK